MLSNHPKVERTMSLRVAILWKRSGSPAEIASTAPNTLALRYPRAGSKLIGARSVGYMSVANTRT